MIEKSPLGQASISYGYDATGLPLSLQASSDLDANAGLGLETGGSISKSDSATTFIWNPPFAGVGQGAAVSAYATNTVVTKTISLYGGNSADPQQSNSLK